MNYSKLKSKGKRARMRLALGKRKKKSIFSGIASIIKGHW